MSEETNQPNKAENIPEEPPLAAPAPLPEGQALGRKKVRTGPGCLSRIFGLFGIILTLTLIAGFIWGLNFSVKFLAPEEESREQVVTIPEGASAARIGQVLEEAGVVKSGQAFVWALRAKTRIKGEPIVLKAGEMILDPSLPVWKTIDLIAKGNYKVYPFTVPEGRNIYDIAQLIEAAGLGSQEAFLALCRDRNFIASLGLEVDTLEGYLFPETYNFPKGTPLKSIVKKMTDTFLNVWRDFDRPAREKGLTRHQVVTLASIVEKETEVARERPVIAGVFYNRLAKGMRLQTDPTVIYGLLPNFNGNITRADLQNPHPYNTYVIQGLPPGPIANPGQKALAAAVKPDIVPFYYFVSKNDGSGEHDFSKTLAEHNKKVNQYLRGGNKNSKKRAQRR